MVMCMMLAIGPSLCAQLGGLPILHTTIQIHYGAPNHHCEGLLYDGCFTESTVSHQPFSPFDAPRRTLIPSSSCIPLMVYRRKKKGKKGNPYK